MISAAARGAMPTSSVSVEFASLDQGGELGGGRLVLLEDVAQHRHAVLDQPEPQGDRGVGHAGGVEPAERVHPGAHRLRRSELGAQVLGQIVHERVELTEELDADLGEGRAGVVPQGDPVADRVRRGRYRVLERSGEARVRLRLRGDPVGIEPIGLALVTAALADRRLVRRHVAHVASGRDEELGQVPAKPAGALHAPAIGRPEPGRPGQAGVMPVAGVREVGVSELAAARVEHGRGERLAVRVDADDVGCRHVVASRVLAVGGRDRATTSQSRDRRSHQVSTVLG